MSDKLASSAGYYGVRETRQADGTVTDVWSDGKTVVSVSGLPGLTVTIGAATTERTSSGAAHGQQTVSVAASNSKTAGSAATAAAAYSASGRSVVKDVMAVGLDRAAAQRLAGQLAVQPQTARGNSAIGPLVSNSSMIGSTCTNARSSDGYVTGTACEVQNLDQANGSDWYVVDEHQSTAHSSDTRLFPDRLYLLEEWIGYGANNTLVKWQPGSTQNVGTCSTITFSITGQNGTDYSQSESICPNTISPHNLNSTPAFFGSAWNGSEHNNDYEGTNSVDMVHSPSNASSAVSLYLHFEW
jgi:hypothetical protein